MSKENFIHSKKKKKTWTYQISLCQVLDPDTVWTKRWEGHGLCLVPHGLRYGPTYGLPVVNFLKLEEFFEY